MIHLNINLETGHAQLEILIKCDHITPQIQKIQDLLHGLQDTIPCTQAGTSFFIPKQDLFYIESVDKRCYLYTHEAVYEVPHKLYELEELLATLDFMRSSKSQILNLAKIHALCPDFGGRLEVTLKNGEKLIVSRQYAKLLKERLGLLK